jgi:hypothetical protein
MDKESKISRKVKIFRKQKEWIRRLILRKSEEGGE